MNTSREHREYLGSLPKQLRLVAGERRLLMCHGSPRRVNEFLWESTTPTHLCERFCRDFGADIIAVTHTGIHWKRALSDGKWFVNVGAIGRPANDGRTEVWYAILDTDREDPVEFISLPYDFRRLAREMSDEGLPEEFIETVLTGYWTTCLEILPARERKRGIH
jgi:predicted phosphodiesterase